MNMIKCEAINLLANNKCELIDYSNSIYKNNIKNIVNSQNKTDNLKIILICGGISTKKEIFALNLKNYLEQKGKKVHLFSIDNFIKKDIQKNCLSDEYIDIENYNMAVLLNGLEELKLKGRTKFLIYDYKNKQETECERVFYDNDSYLILYGFHLFNEQLLKCTVLKEASLIYLDLNTGFETDDGVLDNKDIMLIRYTLDNFNKDNLSLFNSVENWEEILKLNRKIVRENLYKAKFKIDTTLLYEPGVYNVIYRKLIEENNLSIKSDKVYLILKKLSHFKGIVLDKTEKEVMI